MKSLRISSVDSYRAISRSTFKDSKVPFRNFARDFFTQSSRELSRYPCSVFSKNAYRNFSRISSRKFHTNPKPNSLIFNTDCYENCPQKFFQDFLYRFFYPFLQLLLLEIFQRLLQKMFQENSQIFFCFERLAWEFSR